MSDILTFQPGVSLAEGKYLLRSSVQPGRWSVTIHGIRTKDLTAVIIKTPIAAQGKSRFQSAWIRRTFQAMGELNHPSRARILDWFEQDGRPFLVMQKVQGPSLAQQLQKAPLSEAVALQLIRQVAAGLAGIHSQGLLHRDIQPKNIIFRQGVGIPILVDWGLQSVYGPPGGLTPFSAPEQRQANRQTNDHNGETRTSRDILRASLDVYSLAATLYAAVTGQSPTHPAKRQHPVPNPSPLDLAGLIAPRQLQPNLSSATEQALLRGLALNPQQRPSTLESWLKLLPLSQASGTHARRAPSPIHNAPASPGQRNPGPNHPGSSQPRTATSGQVGITQPPPSRFPINNKSPSPASNPPGFAAPPRKSAPVGQALTGQASTSQPLTHQTPHPSSPKAQLTNPPSPHLPLPNLPNSSIPASSSRSSGSSSPSGMNTVSGDRLGAVPHQTPPSNPSAQHRSQRSTLGTVPPVSASRKAGSKSTSASSQLTSHPQTMVAASQRSTTAPRSTATFNPTRRLVSLSLLMTAIGFSGGLLLRVLNPASVVGFSGLGRVQNFPETNWPGETQLDDLPEDVPQPEYGSDRWDRSEEQFPEAILDQAVDAESLTIPDAQPEQNEYPSSSSETEGLSVEDYREALEQASTETESQTSGGYAAAGEGGNTETEAAYSDEYSDDSGSEAGGLNKPGDYSEADSYPQEDYAEEVYPEETYYSELEPDASQSSDGWQDNSPSNWSEDPWVEESPGDWSAEPEITADDFPKPDLPPAYEEAIPQSAIPLPLEGDVL